MIKIGWKPLSPALLWWRHQQAPEAELQTAVKETETAGRTESAMTVGIVEALGGAETTGVQTAKVTGATEDLQSEGDVIGTETAGESRKG